MGPRLGAVGGFFLQPTSEDQARMSKEWPRKEKGGKNNSGHNGEQAALWVCRMGDNGGPDVVA